MSESDRMYGIWCAEDRTWCPSFASPLRGTYDEMTAGLPKWASGEAADVDPTHLHYEVRLVTTATSSGARLCGCGAIHSAGDRCGPW